MASLMYEHSCASILKYDYDTCIHFSVKVQLLIIFCVQFILTELSNMSTRMKKRHLS